jgi:cytoskeletal protein CcmA (bactofilin family)
MKNPFKRDGFDTLIGKGVVLKAATLILPVGTTTVVEGKIDGPHITVEQVDGKADLKTTIVITGGVRTYNEIIVPNVVITGEVDCDKIVVEGTLAIKAGAKVRANEIRYRSLVIENGAVVLAQMNHLDHISAGEQT